MDLPTSVSISVGTVTFGAVALGIARTFRNNRHKSDAGNPGSKNSVSSKECEAHRGGLEKQVKLTEESLSREIELTRTILIREIGEVKESLNRRED